MVGNKSKHVVFIKMNEIRTTRRLWSVSGVIMMHQKHGHERRMTQIFLLIDLHHDELSMHNLTRVLDDSPATLLYSRPAPR